MNAYAERVAIGSCRLSTANENDSYYYASQFGPLGRKEE
jgi:hypothetical protein